MRSGEAFTRRRGVGCCFRYYGKKERQQATTEGRPGEFRESLCCRKRKRALTLALDDGQWTVVDCGQWTKGGVRGSTEPVKQLQAPVPPI